MKQFLIRLFGSFIFIFLLSFMMPLMAQEEPTVMAEEGPELISPSVELIAVQKADGSVELRAAVKAKIEKKLRKMHSLKIHFFLVGDSGETELGSVNANLNGVGVLPVNPEQLIPNNEGLLNFKAMVNANKNMEEGVGEVSVKKARLIATSIAEDGKYSVQIKLVDLSNGTETPIPETTIGVFVKRQFSPLKVAEGTTDEAGDAIIEIPAGLPGDPNGNLVILAKLDENETYGYLEASLTGEKWGLPVSNKPVAPPRALWSAHPPIWMLVTFIILMAAVWGHYFVIVYELFRLRKEAPPII